MMRKVLFICSNCYVRAPLAKARFNQLVEQHGERENLWADAAGAYPGNLARLPDTHIIQLARTHQLDLSQQYSREVEFADLQKFDFVLTLDDDSFERIKLLDKNISMPKLRMLLEFSGQMAYRQVPDPIQGQSSFEECYRIIDQAVAGLFKYLLEDLSR